MVLTLFKCFIFKGQKTKPMQKLLLLSVFIGCLFLLSFRDDNKKKIVFFGDSITEAGAKPGGYIKMMEQMLANAGKAQKYELVGAGIGGNKVYDLYLRMENDVLAKIRISLLFILALMMCGIKHLLEQVPIIGSLAHFMRPLLKKFRHRVLK